MEQDTTLSQIQTIMTEFAQRTGLTPAGKAPRRYLWTDAFGVCNFLGLYQQTDEEQYLTLALQLVDQVHRVLGRHRDDDPRQGWLSGLAEEAGAKHPTMGGLRIGKQLNEREPGAPVDEILEWDRDGQYYHYLTKWMHALFRVSRVTGDAIYHTWAIELAKAAHSGFVYHPAASSRKRMYWKMSIDLSRPLVNSMGHHDPLDAYITYTQLRATERSDGSLSGDIDLETEIADCGIMCAGRSWSTDDPLGTGGLLADAFRLAQLVARFDIAAPLNIASLLADCETGLQAFVRSGSLDQPAEYRLAFRELGLAIGLHALLNLQGLIGRHQDRFASDQDLPKLLARLSEFTYLCDVIEEFWVHAANQQNPTWSDHEDTNSVMLATSLAPDGFLLIH